MKTLLDINKPEYAKDTFGIGLPVGYKDLVMKVLPSLKKLGIAVFIVSKENAQVF